MSVLFAGSPASAALVLKGLVERGIRIDVVLTREDSVQGRKQIQTQTPVAELAQGFGIPVIKANRIDPRVLSELGRFNLEIALVVAYGVILDETALGTVEKGWFNLHYSSLPKYRGAAPVQHALLNGDAETSVTLFKIEKGLDTGPVLSSVPVVIGPDETSQDLLTRMSLIGVTVIAEQIPAIFSGFTSPAPQSSEGVSYAPKLSRADGKLDFLQNRLNVYNRFRAVTLEPGAWALLGGDSFKILEMRCSGIHAEASPGALLMIANRVYVQCLDGPLEIVSVQPSGKGRMNAVDWFRGYRGEPELK